MLKLVLLSLVSAAVAFDYKSKPGLNYDTWWGPPGREVDDPEIKNFTIKFGEDNIKDLKMRLENRRPLVPSMQDSAYKYGVNTQTFDFWPDYWLNKYNFTEREAFLNQFPHKKAQVQGLWIHFIHIKPEVPEGKTSVPVILLHGYPGSVREFYETIPCLAAGAEDLDFVLELVVPSLPAFGFSDYTNRTGMGGAEIAFILRNLMVKLGHKKYYVQGGDWGAHVGSNIATFFPDECLGYHTNMGIALNEAAFALISAASAFPASIVPTDLIGRLYPLKDYLKLVGQESGYFHMQASKPDTVGIALTASPDSMLAWHFQLFSMASRKANINDTKGGLDLYTPEQLLDNAMIHWIPKTAATAIRIYAESFNFRNLEIGYNGAPTPVPTIVVQAKNEIYYMPPAALNFKYPNLVSVDPLDDYGHFLALEAPGVFCESLLNGIKKIREFRKKHNMDHGKEEL